MAHLTGRTLFFTTSPRSPEKMVPEIRLLVDNFSGRKWNKATQTEYAMALSETEFFEGSLPKDPSFTARDRINRGPKSLGFVALEPYVSITPAGREFVSGDFCSILLRQMLKFQLPSPFHTLVSGGCDFRVKPFLEMLRLIRHFGSLKFEEIQIFGMQLTDYARFNEIVSKIEDYRARTLLFSGSGKNYYIQERVKQLRDIYANEIRIGKVATRESRQIDERTFLNTKSSNLRDYTDALFRYLRATGLVSISYSGRAISITRERENDVDYILRNIDREPRTFASTQDYITYLGDVSVPALPSDDYSQLSAKVHEVFPDTDNLPEDIPSLKKMLSAHIAKRRDSLINAQIAAIKDFECYEDVQRLFDSIVNDRSLYDTPLMLEWNTWRALCMMDGGEIHAQLKFDDFGLPMTTAPANTADIIADYGDFGVAVEVTMTNRQRQFEAEGESVFRHTGKLVEMYKKPFYCLLIAPGINPAVGAFFYAMHRTNISFYGGIPKAVPLALPYFRKMLSNARQASYTPTKEQILQFFEEAHLLALTTHDENEWIGRVNAMAVNWTL